MDYWLLLYAYDDLGRLLETLSPDTGTTRYSYDEAGNLRFRIQNGKTEEYRYDVLGRLTQILSSDTSRNVTLTYDTGSGSNLLGRLSSVTDGSGATRYSYDVQGRVISETKTIASETYVTSYGYDAAGNLRSITYPTGQTVQYVADTSDPAKISGVKLNPAGANLPLASNITYLPFGPASNILLGNTVSISKGYDQNYRMSDVYQANGHTVMDQVYTLDDTGNITAIADDLDPTRSKSFGYDALYRLTSATGIYGTLAYTYDKAGNRLTETKPGSQDTYDYFPYTSRLRSVTGTHAELISYDEDGNITSRTPGAANPTPAVTSPSDYVYNAGGQRVMKTKNGAATVYHYDLEGRLIAETDDEGTLKQAYVWLNGEPLAMIGADGSVYYYHNDHLGTPQALTDQAVNLVWSADYLPFGQASVTTATVVNNLRFPGQVYDPETGLNYNWNRYYDPKLGRYITPDPIGLAGGVNLYAYTSNNPVNFIDPMGLEIAYANHPVALRMYHSKIIITPNNQGLYANDPRFQNFDAQGRHFATLGAGPVHGNLVAGVNRERDVTESCSNRTPLSLPSIYQNEDEAIAALFNMLNQYNNKQVTYTLLPNDGAAQYNSNSFVRGIIEAGGFHRPDNVGAIVPGYGNAVPAIHFR